MARKRGSPGKPYGGPWFSRFRDVLRFAGRAQRSFPGLTTRKVAGGFEVRFRAELPGHYEQRNVTILFSKALPRTPFITADGPTESKHRNGDGSLCLWYPWDDSTQRWEFEDGLANLVGLTILHLFREAWWRETGEWLGPEAPHGLPKDAQSALADAG